MLSVFLAPASRQGLFFSGFASAVADRQRLPDSDAFI
jgi:hypothetical protein